MITIKRYTKDDVAIWDAFVDASKNGTIVLNRPYQGLLIVPGIWRTLDDFSSDSVCLVLASEKYDEADYIRDYQLFINYKNDSSII